MSTTLGFKDIIDLPEWRPLAVSPNASGAGCSLAFDLRNNEDRHPEIFQLVSATVLNAYHIKSDGWANNISPALAGTFGAGAGAVFTAMGPRGVIAAGATSSKFTLTTALPAAVAPMQLSGRGDGRGFKLRLIDNGAGGSGKTEERYVLANTAGTTPAVTVETPFSFVPVSGSAYEFLSGRVYCLSAGTLAAGCWKYYDVLTGSMSANLATANLPATINTDASFVALDAAYVPSTADTTDGYHGFFDLLTATATAAGTLTGHVAAGDSGVLANEYRNFTIRIIEDTVNVTAAGQRRRISSHTAGASPVYTLASNWTVTPSATAKFVIENNDDILLWSSASTSTFRYDQIGNTWDTTTYAVRPSAMGAGCMSFQPFGITPDADKNTRHSYIYSFRGAASITLDLFDIAAAATGTWSGATTYAGQSTTFTTGSALAYDPATNSGKFAYVSLNGGQNFFRFNAVTRCLNQWAQLRYGQGTALVGDKMAVLPFVDGATKLGFLYTLRNTGAEFFSLAISR